MARIDCGDPAPDFELTGTSGGTYRTHYTARAQRDAGLDPHLVTQAGFPWSKEIAAPAGGPPALVNSRSTPPNFSIVFCPHAAI